MGSTVTVKIIVISVPKKIIAAIGAHMGLWLIIIGNTPIAATAEVRKMGRIRRFPPSKDACRTVSPF